MEQNITFCFLEIELIRSESVLDGLYKSFIPFFLGYK